MMNVDIYCDSQNIVHDARRSKRMHTLLEKNWSEQDIRCLSAGHGFQQDEGKGGLGGGSL